MLTNSAWEGSCSLCSNLNIELERRSFEDSWRIDNALSRISREKSFNFRNENTYRGKNKNFRNGKDGRWKLPSVVELHQGQKTTDGNESQKKLLAYIREVY